MDKIIYSGDQDALLDQLDGVIGTFYEGGAQVKSASSSVFSRKMMDDHMPDDKHFAVHYIAIGGGETYAQNKNGDWWTEKGLANPDGNHGVHTFVKHGHYFREHNNRDPKKAIGSIRAAAWNPDMRRGEVIVWGDKEKAAKEYARAKAGKTLTCSMSAYVPGDYCSCCGNFAKSSKAYCADLKNHMNQWRPKYSKFAYAINKEPKFFDLSDVENKADRIAFQLEVMLGENTKSASFDGFVFSDVQAKMAGIILPHTAVGCLDPLSQQLLLRLCEAEEYVEATRTKSASVAKDERYNFLTTAAKFAFNTDIGSDEQMEAMRKIEPSVLFGYFAKRAAVMPFKLFFAYTQKQTVKQAAEHPAYQYAESNLLGNLFRDIRDGLSDAELENMFSPASNAKIAQFPIEENAEVLLDQITAECTIKRAEVRRRILQGCVADSPEQVKSASVAVVESDKDKAKLVAKAYGFYKIAFMNTLNASQDEFDDAAVLLVISQHNN